MPRERLTPEQQKMVEANTGLVGFALKRRRTPPDQWDDAFQDGLVGLMRAVQLFDPDRGYTFATYAMYWIRQGIQKGQRDFEGVSFRAAQDGRGEWAPTLSLDVTNVGAGEHDVTGGGAFGEGVLAADDDPAEEALRAGHEALLVAASMGLCRDELDRAVIIATAQGTPLTRVALEFGVSRETPRNRLKWITGRMRHPAMRDRVGRAAGAR